MGARAWREAARSAGVESAERVIVALLIQFIIAAGLFIWATDPQDGLLVRGLTAAAPFLLFPALFVWKWISFPPRLATELDALNSDALARIAAARAELPATLKPFNLYIWKDDVAVARVMGPQLDGHALRFAGMQKLRALEPGDECRFDALRVRYLHHQVQTVSGTQMNMEIAYQGVEFEVVGEYPLYALVE